MPNAVSTTTQQSSSAARKPSDSFIHFIAGGTGACFGAAITCPLELVKTRLQSSLYRANQASNSPLAHVRGVLSLLGDIRRTEGITALWKGLGPTLVGVVPARAIYFGSYNQGKIFYTSLNNGVEDSYVHTASAVTAGVISATCTNPIWVLKTRMQLQSDSLQKQYKNSFDCLLQTVKQEGIRGLYRGLFASFLGVTEGTLQFVLYERFKKIRGIPASSEKTTFEMLETFYIAASAKLIAAMTTYPHEVLRTRLRQAPENGVIKYKSLIQTTALIWREEGHRAFYGGMTAHLMRVVPNAAILFFCYEFVVNHFSKEQKRT